MTTRPALMISIRERLYSAELTAIRALTKGLAERVNPDELDRLTLLGIVEEKLASTEKEADSGVAYLTEVLNTLEKLLPVKKEKDTASKSHSEPAAWSHWKRELKIQGQIGDPKTGVSFLSLVRQIGTASSKGYPETEILEAIIKAIQPGSNLREFIESKSDLTLSNLKQILRAHYKEKNATELYHELSNLTQCPKEDPTEFLMRALGLRQKVLFASTEKSAGLSYSPALVQGMFKHALYTGFVDDAIRHEILPTLDDEDGTDEKLIEALNGIYLREKERKGKIGKVFGSKSVAMATVENSEREESVPVKTPKEGAFTTELRELRAEIQEIKKTLSNSSDTAGQIKATGQRAGCKNCQSTGKERTCQHCWRCGSSEHFRRGCRAQLQGNGKGLQEKGTL